MTAMMDEPAFVAYSSLPRRDYYTVALYQVPVSVIADRPGVRSTKRNVKAEGGALRALAIALPGGRYAQLVTYDARPATSEVLLETFRLRFAYRADLEAVARLLGVSVAEFSWLVSDDVVRFI